MLDAIQDSEHLPDVAFRVQLRVTVIEEERVAGVIARYNHGVPVDVSPHADFTELAKSIEGN